MSDDKAYTVIGGRGSMTVFEIYIKTTPERLWEAITSEQMRKRYSFGVGTASDWTEGSEYRSGVSGVVDIASGKNLEVDPPRRL
ncbi:MAG TPA: SRPBCC domain-containing protein, partial [Solirubrobacterales bacterium]|nr:SRPBCC domain-containing protein [Solirubrobacterales bacterium]